MPKLDEIRNLQEILEGLKILTVDLDKKLTELTEIINCEQFVPELMSNEIRLKLTEINEKQNQFFDQYACIQIGNMPQDLKEASSILERVKINIEDKSKYRDSMDFFLRLHSGDIRVQELLEKHKEKLQAVDFEDMQMPQLEEVMRPYMWLMEAYNETDLNKKFSIIYKLSSKFEEEIAAGVQFKTILLSEKVMDSTAKIITEKTESEYTLEKTEMQETENPVHGKRKAELENSLEICNAYMDEWEQEGIFDAASIIVRENINNLKVECSSKASNKFGVKEFKNEMSKQLKHEKMICMVSAFNEGGYNIDSLSLKNGGIYEKVKDNFRIATEKLFHAGYLKRYTVSGLGKFYALSPRGEKAFSTRESVAFVSNGGKNTVNTGKYARMNDTCNSAIVREIAFGCAKRVKNINSMYSFGSIKDFWGNDYFVYSYSNVIAGINLYFASIISEHVEEFDQFMKVIISLYEDEDILIIIGYNLEQAKAVSQWINMKLSEKKEKIIVYYCDKMEDEYYSIVTEDTVIVESSVEKEEVINAEVIPEEKKVINSNPVKEMISEEPVIYISESERKEYTNEYVQLLKDKKFYGATAYLKSLYQCYPIYEVPYRQLAYALNDPMEKCSYSSDTIFNVFYGEETSISEYFVVAAAARNYFLDQYSYDYSLQQLQSILAGNSVLRDNAALDNILYELQQFKTKYHCGIDKYADYRVKGRIIWERKLEEIKREARSYFENYSSGALKENASHKRFLETEKLLFGLDSDLSEYLIVVKNDDREMLDVLEDFLEQYYVREQAVICKENIDLSKIENMLDVYWKKAAQNMRLTKKTSDLMSSLRMNLFKRVNKVVGVLCDYVFLIKSNNTSENDPGLLAYKKLKTSLIKDIDAVIRTLKFDDNANMEDCAGRNVLIITLEELNARLSGSYKEESNQYFYIDFLKNEKILLDEDFLPILDEVLELPDFSVRNRIKEHCSEEEKTLDVRLQEIFSGKDDYGTAELIIHYINAMNITFDHIDMSAYDVEKAIVFPLKDMENKRKEFIEDLELAQSYGQIDNTIENSKEIMLQIMETWFLWAHETKNYGFFAKILNAFKDKIKQDAQVRAVELENSLQIYLDGETNWNEDEVISNTVKQIQERIKQQNYAAAEDLLNRLVTNDLDLNIDLHQAEYLEQFLNEYEINYRKTANSGTTLRSLVNTSQVNKDTKGASRLLQSWPKSAKVRPNEIQTLMSALGFNVGGIKEEAPINGKIESCIVTLERPQNGRKSNYKHPIAAFGSEAETNGFRVVCIFGKADATRLVDIFKEIGNARNTLVVLDYALNLADRRTLARKTKTDLSGKIFAVIDRVVLVYLAKHYTETAVNRMLMSIIMPFASCQPYIDKSADVMPQEMFIGRKAELEKIESATGVNIVYGGRQLGKTALLCMAKKDIDMNENGDRALIVDVWGKDYKAAAKTISAALYDEHILKKENITEDWNELARDIKNRLRDNTDPIPYFLLMIDEADAFIESCEEVGYQPFNALKDIQSVGTGRFKFVVAGLRNIVRFKKAVALGNNSVLAHLDSLTVKPFKSMEARELLEGPLSYLGFRFLKDNETEVLISTIFGTTNYFPGLIQLYCTKLIEAMKRDYAGYSESETPPYIVQKDLIKKVLAEQTLQQDIREKFFITLKVGDDDYYYIIALLVAYHYHENKSQNGCTAQNLIELAEMFGISKIVSIELDKVSALMEEMRELNVLQNTKDGRYRFARHSFCEMMGKKAQIEDELLKYMED